MSIGSDWAGIACTQMWQVTMLIVVVALLARLAAADRPQLASTLWLVVLLKCMTPPLWSSPAGAFCWLQPRSVEARQDSPGGLSVALPPAHPAPTVVPHGSSLPIPDGEIADDGWGAVLPHPAALVGAVWGVGVVAALAAIAMQWRRVARLVRLADAGLTVPHMAALASLSRRLGIRRHVRLVVADSPIGPAVLGLTRPTVLLPKDVVSGKSADEVELILAHELMHVRRGDLWSALLWSLAISLWWFHPLVWWARRKASREAERCCDDAVLAEVRCSPIRYARCLLGILEAKHRLSPVAAFPGVRAIEVNQGRLERIMKIGHGGYRRTPWWCWGAAIVAAIAALPGAAIPGVAHEPSGPPQPAASPGPLAASAAEPGRSRGVAPPVRAGLWADGDKSPSHSETYSVKDILARIREDRGLERQEAQDFLAGLLMAHASQPMNQRTGFDRLVWRKSGEEIVIRASRSGHEQVAVTLDALRKFGSAEIAMEVRFVSIPEEEAQKELADWTISPFQVPEAALADPAAVQPAAFEHGSGDREGTCVARTQLVVEKLSPVRYRILDKEQAEKLTDRFQRDARTNVLQAPKTRVFNGGTVSVSDASQTPFVVGVKEVGPEALQPQIRVVSEGTKVQLRPIADRTGAIHLNFAATFSAIRKVETATFAIHPDAKADTTVQVPEVATDRIEGRAVLKKGQWLLLRGVDLKDREAKDETASASWIDRLMGAANHQKPRKTQALVLMLRAEKI